MEYRLDLSTLLLMLRRGTGKLSSELQHVPGVKVPCQVFVQLEEGSITACLLKDKRGREIVSGKAAIKLIQDQVLKWHYTEDQRVPPASQNVPPSLSQETSGRLPLPQEMPGRQPLPQETPGRQLVPVVQVPIPRRTRYVSQGEFLSWPRLYRAIYSLIDSKVSVHHIVILLAKEQTAERVLEVLADLQRGGLITIDRRPLTGNDT